MGRGGGSQRTERPGCHAWLLCAPVPTPPLRRLLRHARAHRKTVWLATACSVLNKLFDLAPPALIGAAVDVVVEREDSLIARLGVTDVMDQLLVLAVATVVVWGLESVFEYAFGVLWRNLAQTVQHELRLDAWRHIQDLDLAWYAQQSRGETGVDLSAQESADNEAYRAIEEALSGRGGESMVSEELARHIVTKVTDEGLIIELFATEDAPLFEPGRDTPTQLYRDLMRMVARVTGVVSNNVAINGHTRSRPLVVADNPVWSLSSARADVTRQLLESGGMKSSRIHRVAGHADRKLAASNPMALRNSRVEIVLLRN